MEALLWIKANYEAALTGALAVIGGLSVLAKLTPTPKDDEVLAKLVKVLDFFALNKQR